jgi:hypothetical protein
MAKRKPKSPRGFVVCLSRGTYRIDLDVGKVYRLAAPEKNDPIDMLRVIDNSGDDYLYPADWFVPVLLPARARRILATT